MKKLFVLLFLCSLFSFAQEDAWVYFKDKPNAKYYLDNPLEMLSQRALDRRKNQNIALNENDTPVHQPYIDQITAATGITVKAKSKWLNCLHIRGNTNDIKALINLTFVKNIVFASKNISELISNKPTSIQNKNNLKTKTNFNYGNSLNQIKMLNGNILHQQNYTGTGKIIAILDDGFTGVNTVTPFKRLIDNNQILGGYNFVDKNTNIYTNGSHGTDVLSTIGGYIDNQLVGTAPEAQFYLYITEVGPTENPVEESNWVEAAEMADSVGADIINSSLGYFGYDNPNYSHVYADMTGDKNFASRGANIAFSKGIVVLASAGNSGNSKEPHVGVPAEAMNVLAVGSVAFDRIRTSFSSIGPSYDGRVKPDIMAQGESSVVSDVTGNITTASGTSFSCPIVAGMVACIWQAVPNVTNVQIVDYIKKASDNYTTPNANYGYGIPDFVKAINLAKPDLNLEIPKENKTFLLYPNPVVNQATIIYPDADKNVSFEVFNDLGQSILINENIKSNPFVVNLSNLNSGFYFYKFTSSKNSSYGKFLKK